MRNYINILAASLMIITTFAAQSCGPRARTTVVVAKPRPNKVVVVKNRPVKRRVVVVHR